MMVLIYGFFSFPRMSAGANYAQYLAMALKNEGNDVSIIAPGNCTDCSVENDGFLYYKGIRYIPLSIKQGKIAGFIDYYITQASYIIRAIKELGMSSGDIVIGYIPEAFVIGQVSSYCRKHGILVGNCVDELFGEEQLKDSHIVRKYSYKKAISKAIPKCNFVIPISTYIEQYYKKMNCNTFVLPIMADVQEFPYNGKEFSETIKIIYPANGMIKDNFFVMMESIASLPEKYITNVEFHITSIKKEYIIEHSNRRLSSLFDRNIIVHDWLEYDELIDLYRKMDYMLLARDVNQMALANFPSKVPETMTYGVIPIVSRVGDYTTYYLQDGVNSVTFDGSDVESCTLALMRALDFNYTQRQQLSGNARRCVEEKFDYHIWAPKLNSWLNTL